MTTVPSKEAIPALIGATRLRLRQEIGRLTTPLGLTPHHVHVLTLLRDGGPMTMHDVATRIRVDDATVSRMMSKLGTRKWVRIERDRSDRRRAIVGLTAAGKRVTNGFTAKATKLIDQIMTGLSADQLDVTRDALRRILENLDKLIDGQPQPAPALDD